ncbi:hypothetical protein Tco_1056378 [Tanacetum coccineum]|uniref:Uncharacterized protein n=1 Tax=Tanacetum coccineum TaxID=301880 RepID=A0ABQ5H2I6_9ASTR
MNFHQPLMKRHEGVDNVVPDKPVKTSVRTKPITASQPNVIHKQHANSDSTGFSPTSVNNAAKTRRPQPARQCFVTANHDVCMLNYVNDMNSQADYQSANVSKTENQKKHKANVRKSKKVESKGSHAPSRTCKPRTYLMWLPTGRTFDLCGYISSSSNTESESDTSVCDNASTSNPQEPTHKGFPSSTSSLGSQNRRDLPRNTSLDRVEVLGMIEKRSKVRIGIMPTEAELVLEQSQQGVSYEVLSRKIQDYLKAKYQDIKFKDKDIKSKIKIQDHKHAEGSSNEFPRQQGFKAQDITKSEATYAMTTP